MYYHLSRSPLAILSGPHSVNSDYIRKLTRCGTPEVLDLSAYDLVPEVREPLGPDQTYGEPVVSATAVTIPARDKTEADLEAERSAYLDGIYCTALQAELELIHRNLWPTVNLWIDQQDAVTQAFFRRAQTWQYRDSRLQAGATALGLSDAQLIEILESARLR